MKHLLFIFCFLLALRIDGQVLKGKSAGLHIVSPHANDTLIVSYLSQDFNKKDPLIFVNGQKVEMILLNSINVDHIDSISVKKANDENSNIYENGEIHIQMKKEYEPSFISLSGLKSKYLKDLNIPTIFMINGRILDEDLNNSLVDENYILKLEIQEINRGETLHFQLIKLVFKTEENIDKQNRILLR